MTLIALRRRAVAVGEYPLRSEARRASHLRIPCKSPWRTHLDVHRSGLLFEQHAVVVRVFCFHAENMPRLASMSKIAFWQTLQENGTFSCARVLGAWVFACRLPPLFLVAYAEPGGVDPLEILINKEESLERKRLSHRLRNAMRRTLTDFEAFIVNEYWFEGKKQEELANATGLSCATISRRLSTALIKLEGYLKK